MLRFVPIHAIYVIHVIHVQGYKFDANPWIHSRIDSRENAMAWIQVDSRKMPHDPIEFFSPVSFSWQSAEFTLISTSKMIKEHIILPYKLWTIWKCTLEDLQESMDSRKILLRESKKIHARSRELISLTCLCKFFKRRLFEGFCDHGKKCGGGVYLRGALLIENIWYSRTHRPTRI